MISFVPIKFEDYDYFISLNNNPDNLKWMESDIPASREQFLRLLNHPTNHWYVVYDTNFRKMKKIKVGLFTSYLKEDELHVGIIVDKEHRRKGYATKMFKHFLKHTDDRRLDTYLSCFADNFAVKMYRKLGYKKLDEDIIVRGKRYIKMKREAQ